MEVMRADTAGFCMGVSLALRKLEEALESYDKKGFSRPERRICTLGPIIHNPQVLSDFSSRGVVCISSPEDAMPGDMVLIRAHGITRTDEDRLRLSGAEVRDATCPRVKKAQLEIARATENGATLLLFGEADHPEVRGLVSYACGKAHIFCSRHELDSIALSRDERYVLASQTTQDRGTFDSISGVLAQSLPLLTVLRTICDATRKRQEEALRIAREVDIMVIVGGRQSGNTRRLAALASLSGIESLHVESAGELSAKSFAKKKRAGLTAGASTPKSLIDETENWLQKL